MDSLPQAPPALAAAPPAAPGDIYPRDNAERELCARASRPDWMYLGGLGLLDVATVWAGSSVRIKYAPNVFLRATGPVMIGFAWGATLGGAWLALPKCSPDWVDEAPREGRDRPSWPLALSIAVLAGVTAPVVSFIAIGYCSQDPSNPQSTPCQQGFIADSSTLEREARLVVAGVAGFGGALLPYLVPPSTVRAARELERIRVGADVHAAFVEYAFSF